MTKRLICPCGTLVEGRDEDDLVVHAQAHLEQRHPGRNYSRDEILALAL